MDDQDPDVSFIISGSNEQVETLLERVRGSIEKAFNESPNFMLSPTAKQQVLKPVFTVDFSAKTVKDLLQYANTRDPQVQVKAINELIARWKPDIASPRGPKGEGSSNETLIAQIKAERGLRILINLAVESKDSTVADVVACQSRLVKLLALLTESSVVRDQVRQIGAVPSIAQMLSAWAPNVALKRDLMLNGLVIVSNLCLDEVHANAVRKANGIPTIVSLVTSQSDVDVKMAALNALITLSNSSVKNQEAIVTDALLEYLFNEIKNKPPPAIENNYLQLLLNLSTCAKTRAVAASKSVLSLLSLLRITEVYPKIEMYQIRKYYRNTDVAFDGMPNSEITTRQGTIFEILTNFMQNESHRQALAADGSWLTLITSYLAPVYNIPFDMYKWNFSLVAHAMKLTINLIIDDSIRSMFIMKDGYALTTKYLTFSDIFPPNILLAAGELISALGSRRTEGAHLAMSFGTEGLPPLLRLYTMFPSNERLQLLVARTINTLAVEERNRITVFQEGGLQALSAIANTENDDVAIQACEAFSHLSSDKLVRRAIRVVGTIVPTLLRLLQKPKVSLQKPCIIVLCNLTLEDEGLDLVADMKTGATPAILTPLMQSSETIIQANALKILAVCVKKEIFLSKFVEMQGLPTVLEVLLSQSSDVQAGALDLLANLALNGDCREMLRKLGLVDKLKAFAKHRMLAAVSYSLFILLLLFLSIFHGTKKNLKFKKKKKRKKKKKTILHQIH
eukprot:Phypoly_transcript_01022.p1 GENE.Phypoly_transcript_01022~~Phypoly_transcript_01022.p1  ORF type:complete len:737 (+),score=112.33 Phypoly_transcript_01022:150-2360(+)